MAKTLRTAEHAQLIALLKHERHRAGLTQQEVADRLGVPQSFVAKYEGGERRLDLIEFLAVARALESDPVDLLARLVEASTQARSSTSP